MVTMGLALASTLLSVSAAVPAAYAILCLCFKDSNWLRPSRCPKCGLAVVSATLSRPPIARQAVATLKWARTGASGGGACR